MKFYVNWRTATKAIFKNRKRSFLTMFGIIIGIAAVITIMAVGHGATKEMVSSLNNSKSDEVKIDVDFSPENDSLSDSNVAFFNDPDLSIVEHVSGVKEAVYPKEDDSEVYKQMVIDGKTKNKQVALTKFSDKKVKYGRNLTTYDNATQNKVAVIDSVTAKELYKGVKNALNRGVAVDGQDFMIVGIYPGVTDESLFSFGSDNIIVPRDTYHHYFNQEQSKNYIEVTLKTGVVPAKVTTKVVKALKRKGTMRQLGDYEVEDTSILTDGVTKGLNMMTNFVSVVAGISLFIAGVGVMNMMYISVSERTKEIGIRRAMGATGNSIRIQFLLEGVSLTLVGGIIGYILGMILASMIGAIMEIPISIELSTVLLAASVSSGIGLIFSVMPASAAANKDLIDILK